MIFIQLISLLVIFKLLSHYYNVILEHLNHDIYLHSDSFFLSAFSDLKFGLFFLFVVLFLVFNYKKISWNQWNNQKVLKIFIMIVAFPLFWENAFLDYNYYLDTNFTVDRILIFITFLLIFIHPIFVFVLLTIGFLSWNIISFPLSGTHWIDVRPAYEILTLFVSFLIIKSINKFKDISINIFFFLALTLHVSNYFVPGIAKIEISPHGWEWVLLDNANNLFVSAYNNGWLAFLNQETVIWIAHYLDKADFLFTVPTLLLQVFAVVLLLNRKLTLTTLLLFEALHFGVILVGGIVFWVWIIVNIGFIYLFKNLSTKDQKFFYDKKIFFTFVVIVGLSPILYKPPVLAWWDSTMHTTYDLFITTDNKEKRKVNILELAPYNTIFAQNNFAYLSKQPAIIPYNYGFIIRDMNEYANSFLLLSDLRCNGCLQDRINSYPNDSYEVYKLLEKADSIDEMKNIIQKYGKSYYNEDKREKLKEFLHTYFSNYNKRGKKNAFYTKLGSPYHQYDLTPKSLIESDRVQRVEIIRKNMWYNKRKGEIISFDEKSVLSIDIR